MCVEGWDPTGKRRRRHPKKSRATTRTRNTAHATLCTGHSKRCTPTLQEPPGTGGPEPRRGLVVALALSLHQKSHTHTLWIRLEVALGHEKARRGATPQKENQRAATPDAGLNGARCCYSAVGAALPSGSSPRTIDGCGMCPSNRGTPRLESVPDWCRWAETERPRTSRRRVLCTVPKVHDVASLVARAKPLRARRICGKRVEAALVATLGQTCGGASATPREQAVARAGRVKNVRALSGASSKAAAPACSVAHSEEGQTGLPVRRRDRVSPVGREGGKVSGPGTSNVGDWRGPKGCTSGPRGLRHQRALGKCAHWQVSAKNKRLFSASPVGSWIALHRKTLVLRNSALTCH